MEQPSSISYFQKYSQSQIVRFLRQKKLEVLKTHPKWVSAIKKEMENPEPSYTLVDLEYVFNVNGEEADILYKLSFFGRPDGNQFDGQNISRLYQQVYSKKVPEGNNGKARVERVPSSSREGCGNSSAVSLYMKNIGSIPLLTPQEEIALAERIKQGDSKALEKLVLANTRFVISVAKEYWGRGTPLEDLISAGNIGLIKAAQKYDGQKGYKFISYAVWWIRQSIQSTLDNEGRGIRLPINKIKDITDLAKTNNSLSEELERKPSVDELAERLGKKSERIQHLLEITQPIRSLDYSPNEEEQGDSVLDLTADEEQLPPDAELIQKSMKGEIVSALDSLPEKEALILRLYFGFEGEERMNFSQIGNQIDLTRERVRQLKEKALNSLRHPSRARKLKEYLEEETPPYVSMLEGH
ncbi:MAG: RNA polymerase sigma factor RpoD/SigA [Nanoarchaeota archaeon]|nr:RNA polymerase sigma factor RpoD/SigA [Nanoarchaeota archaeon]